MEGSFREKNNIIEYRVYIDGIQKSFSGKTKEIALNKYKQYIDDTRNKQLEEASILTDTSGIRLNKNSFEYRKSIDGKQVSFHTKDIEDALRIKQYVDKKIDNYIFTDKTNKDNNLGKYIYFVSNGMYCKIGFSSNVNRRLSDLQVASSEKLELLYSFYTIDYKNIEKEFHKIFKQYNVSGEWYDILFLFKQ